MGQILKRGNINFRSRLRLVFFLLAIAILAAVLLFVIDGIYRSVVEFFDILGVVIVLAILDLLSPQWFMRRALYR